MIGRLSAGLLQLGLAAAIASSAVAQPGLQPPAQPRAGAWDGPRARALIGRAIERRASWTEEGGLEDYRAHARGYIYFLYDLGRNTERHLIKADQLALDVFWRAPDRSRQLIVGRREKKILPTDIRYHLDHLTVVMDNYSDRIHMGESAEVQNVLHPAAPGALDFYEYRMVDSLTLVMPEREVRVYKVEVRPRDPATPGLVGALYMDRASADIVKMEFTFTAATYIDKTVDYINVRLENAMWYGRYWLPYRQGIELRRELEFLNFPAGSIIRAELSIRDYEFNTGMPDSIFRGPTITSLSASALASFEFEGGLYDALDPTVAVTSPSLEEIREEASRIVSEAYLQKLDPLRLAVPGASSIFRFRRAEGAYLGPGASFGLPGGGDLLLLGGYAIGADRLQLEGRVRMPLPGAVELQLSGYLDRVDDASAWPASSGAVATLAAIIDGDDYREPYWFSGGRLALSWPWAASRVRAELGWESWEAAALETGEIVDRSYRPVRRLDEGEVVRLGLGIERRSVTALEAVGGSRWEVRLEAATPSVAGDFEYVFAAASAERLWPRAAAGVDVRLSAAAGGVGGGRIPAQRLFPAGGRGSVRGYDFHRFVGNLYGSMGLELGAPIRYPFLSAAVFADAGWVGIEGAGAARAVDVWNEVGATAGATDGLLIGAGVGVGLFFDIIRLELARGLRQRGIWEFVFRVKREFWDWL